ncbi:hypothetical protein FNW10_14835 [Flavobacterium gawalongense]|uniref:Uncharacterized protein n=1 Tax=Flavobacterium gawalongense TaxID=2594432 RepID=A0A553BP19_9FLAO|nr:hypothetical protein FNW12_15435 [Flavobacterium gawalongense]TRX03888.1 hypothetical protein FNW33_02145 [Flavobacterium gawalongense]TRX07221.1 hypothetical protein FNW10_14835 [Flavobacterium gawalongense]TRX09999.1 hypothetical protein FNW11_08815 [Flavobacterium gawalongense]TRX23277.1 hypothetical protein FNW38_14970 [Flavobacterium gawalongense]
MLNENSMWSGGVENPNRDDASQHLPEIQRLLKKEKIRKPRSCCKAILSVLVKVLLMEMEQRQDSAVARFSEIC